MVQKTLTRLDRWQQALAEKHLLHLLAYGAAVIAAVFGIVLIATPEAFLRAPTFEVTFSLARPEAWGLAFVLTGILLAIGFWRDRVSGQIPAFVLTALYCVFGISSSVTPLSSGEGVLSAGVIYTGMSWFSFVVILACGPRRDRDHG